MESSPLRVPDRADILIIGGGPGGSYAAAALAREGLDVVLLEADKFPRYHVGESMLASMRHFLRLIDLDDKFNDYGFTRKVGAAFKLNSFKREGFTDFLAGGPENYAWNVVRSEADDLMFRYAGECGAKVFDGVKVAELAFEGDPSTTPPLSAKWAAKGGASGVITFDYLVDASGRNGLMSAKYLKNRVFNQGLKNVASWGYWTGCGVYAEGTPRSNAPFFEALQDESGWAWMIPLHNGTTSIGVVMNQDISNKKKSEHWSGTSPSLKDHYLEQLQFAPAIVALIGRGELQTDGPAGSSGGGVKSASDYSYSAASYAGDHYRIVGDAGAFIDPYFSSGVHLALTGALSAALTICAARRGDCTEAQAARWHTDRVAMSYTRFLLVVLSAYKQIRAQAQPVLADVDEDNFDRAFALFRPVIQGAADVERRLTQGELARTVAFCMHAFEPTQPAERAAVLAKVASAAPAEPATSAAQNSAPAPVAAAGAAFNANLTQEEQKVLNHINARKMMRTEDTMHIANFAADVIDGLVPRLARGSLGLTAAQS